jgi:hypothetical protein
MAPSIVALHLAADLRYGAECDYLVQHAVISSGTVVRDRIWNLMATEGDGGSLRMDTKQTGHPSLF